MIANCSFNLCFLIISDVEHLFVFSFTCWPFVHLLWKNIIQVFCTFLNQSSLVGIPSEAELLSELGLMGSPAQLCRLAEH